MTIETLKAAALTALIAGVPFLAHAGLTVGDTVGTTVGEIEAALVASGAEVKEVEVEGDEIEVTYLLDGELFEIEVAVGSGVVTEMELEDDDDYEDDDDEDD